MGATGAAFAVHGQSVQSFMRTSDFLNVYTVELYAILMAVRWAEQLENCRVVICSDSVSAVKSIGVGLSKSRKDLIYEILVAKQMVKRRGVELALM